MSETSCSYFNLFGPHAFPMDIEDEYIQNNITIDFSFGHEDILRHYVRKHPQFSRHYDFLVNLAPTRLCEEVQQARARSVLMCVIMLTGKCDADCQICCTDRRYKGNKELSANEIERILIQAKDMGCKTIYVPGEGEPLLDKSIWRLLALSSEMGISVVLFTNGLILSNDTLAQLQWELTSEEIIRRLREYNVYIYHKLWSTSPKIISEVMQIPETLYNWEQYAAKGNGHGKHILIPKGLRLLLDLFPRDHVGIETVILNRNYDEIKNVIIPFVQDAGIRSYIEPLIHGGRCFGIKNYDVDPSCLEALSPWVSRLKCRRLGYKLFVDNAGYLSFGIQVPVEQILPERKEEFNIRNENGSIKDLFQLIHTHRVLVNGRYATNGCLCEKISAITADKNMRRFTENDYFELCK